jgi:ribosome-associated translation inhibitor RaiA
MTIPKPGKTKQQLLEKLERFKEEYSKQIDENDVTLEKTNDGYRVKAQKKVLFMNFHVNAEIIAKDGEYEITWESNAPESKVNEALEKVRRELEKA